MIHQSPAHEIKMRNREEDPQAQVISTRLNYVEILAVYSHTALYLVFVLLDVLVLKPINVSRSCSLKITSIDIAHFTKALAQDLAGIFRNACGTDLIVTLSALAIVHPRPTASKHVNAAGTRGIACLNVEREAASLASLIL